MQWTADRATAALAALANGERPFCMRDHDGWTFVINFLSYHPFASPNHQKSADFLLSQMPKTSPLLGCVIEALANAWNTKYLPRPKYLEAASKPLLSSFEGTSNGVRTPEKEPYPEPEPINITKNNSSERALAPSRKREAAAPLPMDWEPDQIDLKAATDLGLINGSVQIETTKYRNYFTVGKGAGIRRTPRGWRTSWVNWCSKTAQHGIRGPSPPSNQPASNNYDEIIKRIEAENESKRSARKT